MRRTDSGLPPITQTAFSTCRAHYPGGPIRCASVGSMARSRARFFPNRFGLPGTNGRSAPTIFLSRPAQASLTLRPIDLLAHLTWTLSRGSHPHGYPPRWLVSYPGIPTPPGVGLSPTGGLRRWGARLFRNFSIVKEPWDRLAPGARLTPESSVAGGMGRERFRVGKQLKTSAIEAEFRRNGAAAGVA